MCSTSSRPTRGPRARCRSRLRHGRADGQGRRADRHRAHSGRAARAGCSPRTTTVRPARCRLAPAEEPSARAQQGRTPEGTVDSLLGLEMRSTGEAYGHRPLLTPRSPRRPPREGRCPRPDGCSSRSPTRTSAPRCDPREDVRGPGLRDRPRAARPRCCGATASSPRSWPRSPTSVPSVADLITDGRST